MSKESNIVIAIRNAGYTCSESNAEWCGSIEASWNRYVEQFHIPECERPKSSQCIHEVYWMTFCFVDSGSQFVKIGISKNSKARLRGQCSSFPLGNWSLTRVAVVRSHARARQCEIDMLVACRRLHFSGEWLRVQ